MKSRWIIVTVGMLLSSLCLFAFSKPLYATRLATNSLPTILVRTEQLQTVMLQTDIITDTVGLTSTATLTDTEVIFFELAKSIQEAELFRFRGVGGMLVSIYDPSRFQPYHDNLELLADTCGVSCAEPQCEGPYCPEPYPLPCCVGSITLKKPCYVAPTSTLEINYKRVEFSSAVLSKHPEHVNAAVEVFSKISEDTQPEP